MVGVQLALGVATAPVRAVVQSPGSAWRISASALRSELRHSAVLQRGLHRYLCVVLAQLVRSSGCLRFHLIGPRLAGWLLMTQDHAQADSFPATHEVIAYLLGVRRAGVTNAASALRRRGLIRYGRGDLTVLDRSGLQAAACACYAANQEDYAGLLLQPHSQRARSGVANSGIEAGPFPSLPW